MKKWTNPKAFMFAISIFAVGTVINILLMDYEFLRAILLGIPFFVAILFAQIYEYFGGHVDHIGKLGEEIFILFIYYGFASIIGSMFGIYLRKINGSS